jgi:hypothetical protein
MTGRRHSRLSKIAHFPTGSSIHTESRFSSRASRNRKFYRSVKKPVTMRLDSGRLSQFESVLKGLRRARKHRIFVVTLAADR